MIETESVQQWAVCSLAVLIYTGIYISVTDIMLEN